VKLRNYRTCSTQQQPLRRSLRAHTHHQTHMRRRNSLIRLSLLRCLPTPLRCRSKQPRRHQRTCPPPHNGHASPVRRRGLHRRHRLMQHLFNHKAVTKFPIFYAEVQQETPPHRRARAYHFLQGLRLIELRTEAPPTEWWKLEHRLRELKMFWMRPSS